MIVPPFAPNRHPCLPLRRLGGVLAVACVSALIAPGCARGDATRDAGPWATDSAVLAPPTVASAPAARSQKASDRDPATVTPRPPPPIATGDSGLRLLFEDQTKVCEHLFVGSPCLLWGGSPGAPPYHGVCAGKTKKGSSYCR
jgi:hypothetical protein